MPISPAILAISLKESNERCLSSDPKKLCDRINFLLQENQAGNNCDLFNEEIVTIVDKLSENICISTEQQKFFSY